MATKREERVAELEKQLGTIEAEIEKLSSAEGDDDVDDSGGGDADEDEPVRKRERMAKTDDEVEDEDKPVKKAKKKVDAEDSKDGGADEDMEGDDWSKGGKKGMKKADKKAEEGDDETITVDGQVIAKSAVGDANFAIFKGILAKQSAELSEAKKDIAKERDLRETAVLEKRADADFPHVPGTTQERGAMLKAIGGMSKELQKSFESVFTASEKLAKAAFETIGKGPGKGQGEGENGDDFNKKVAEIKKRDSCTAQEASTKARKEFPDLFKAFQAQGN